VRFGAALVVLAMAVAACGGGGAGDGGAGDEALGSVTAALALLPADDLGSTPQVSWGDLDAATELAGVERPSGAADAEAVQDWLRALLADPHGEVFVPLPNLLAGPRARGGQDEIDAELGWSLVDVHRFAEVHALPHVFFLGTGGLPLDGPGVEDLGDGVRTAGDGEDRAQDIDGRTAVRPLGAPIRLGSDSGVLAASDSTEAVERWLAGEHRRLIDEDGWEAVGSALDDHGVVGAVLFPHRPAGLAWDADLIGMGWTRTGEGPRAVLALHLIDPDQAGAAATALEEELRDGGDLRGRDFAELFSVVDVAALDGVVVAVVEPARSPRILHDLLVQRDAPFVPRGR
jgi:hypothetical protein